MNAASPSRSREKTQSSSPSQRKLQAYSFRLRNWFLDAEAEGLGQRDYTAVLARILTRPIRLDSSSPP
jgi:hypothetical protein